MSVSDDHGYLVMAEVQEHTLTCHILDLQTITILTSVSTVFSGIPLPPAKFLPGGVYVVSASKAGMLQVWSGPSSQPSYSFETGEDQPGCQGAFDVSTSHAGLHQLMCPRSLLALFQRSVLW